MHLTLQWRFLVKAWRRRESANASDLQKLTIRADGDGDRIQFLRTSLRTVSDRLVNSISMVSIVILAFETHYSSIMDIEMRTHLSWYLDNSAVCKTTLFGTTSIAAMITVRKLARSDCSCVRVWGNDARKHSCRRTIFVHTCIVSKRFEGYLCSFL